MPRTDQEKAKFIKDFLDTEIERYKNEGRPIMALLICNAKTDLSNETATRLYNIFEEAYA